MPLLFSQANRLISPSTSANGNNNSNGTNANAANHNANNLSPHSSANMRSIKSNNVPASTLMHANSKLINLQRSRNNGYLSYQNLASLTTDNNNSESIDSSSAINEPVIMGKHGSNGLSSVYFHNASNHGHHQNNSTTLANFHSRHSINYPTSMASIINNTNSSSTTTITPLSQQFKANSYLAATLHHHNHNQLSNASKSSSTLKTRRSGSIASILPLRENNALTNNSINNNNNHATNHSTTTTTTAAAGTNTNLTTSGKSSKFKLQPLPKRRKSNSLSIMDYCNFMNMNTNFQMLANFFDDTEASMSRLSMKTTRNANIEKQASLSEQMAALFGSSMCTCSLCKLKLTTNAKKPNNATTTTTTTTSAAATTNALVTTNSHHNQNNAAANQTSQSTTTTTTTATTSMATVPLQQYNFEIMPNRHNTDYCIIKYTYSSPFSQLSPLKLFNLMNTDCSIIFNAAATVSAENEKQVNGATEAVAGSEEHGLQFSSNSPPIYDQRYLYIIDCRLNRKHFEKSRIHTAIHYSDLLNDSVYVSPPTDHYTLVVLYDKDGTFLTSTSPLATTNQAAEQQQQEQQQQSASIDDIKSSDDMIARIKVKLNCNPSKTFYLLSGGYEQFHASFPAMCSNLDIRSTVDRHKYLTIYPNCVIENTIYIGSGIQAKNWKIIRDLHITHVINCSIEHECVFKDEIKYLHVKLEDTYEENIYKILDKTIQFMQEAVNKYYVDLRKYEESAHESSSAANSATNSTTNVSSGSRSSATSTKPAPPRFLIHCNLGISRSSSILIAYLMSKYKLCLYAAFNYVKDKRIQIAPNYSFLRQLKQFEETYCNKFL